MNEPNSIGPRELNELCATIRKMSLQDIYHLMGAGSYEIMNRACKFGPGTRADLGVIMSEHLTIAFARGNELPKLNAACEVLTSGRSQEELHTRGKG